MGNTKIVDKACVNEEVLTIYAHEKKERKKGGGRGSNGTNKEKEPYNRRHFKTEYQIQQQMC